MARTLKQLIQPTWFAVRTYWPAILIIQLLALGVVIAYYTLDGASGFFEIIAQWKTRGGLLFSAIATVISGTVIPECLKHLFRPKGRTAPKASELLHQAVMFACIGIFVDLFYRLQGQVFGNGYDWQTLVPKVLCDQFVFTPFVSMSFIVSWFLLYEHHYHLGRWWQAWTLKEVIYRILPLWTSCLAFWPVMLAIVYSLPQDLQFPLFLFGNSAYSILMIFIARQQSELDQVAQSLP